MVASGPGESRKVQRDRIRRSLLKCLKPIQAQEDSFMGCLAAVGTYPILVLLIRFYFDTSLLASIGWAVPAWFVPLGCFGLYNEAAERRSRTRGYELFEMTYAPGSTRRVLAISVLREMSDGVHSHSAAASLLLAELGEDQLTEPPPETQLDEQLDTLVTEPESDLNPFQWREPQDKEPDRVSHRPTRRYDHIPLEPEDPENKH